MFSLWWEFKISQSIDYPISEIHSVIYFVISNDVKAAEIYHQINEAYEKNSMSERLILKNWLKHLKMAAWWWSYMMMNETADLLLKIWYKMFMEKFERCRTFPCSSTSFEQYVLRFHLYLKSFLMIQKSFLHRTDWWDWVALEQEKKGWVVLGHTRERIIPCMPNARPYPICESVKWAAIDKSDGFGPSLFLSPRSPRTSCMCFLWNR